MGQHNSLLLYICEYIDGHLYALYIYIYRKGRNYMNEVELEVARESEREKNKI